MKTSFVVAAQEEIMSTSELLDGNLEFGLRIAGSSLAIATEFQYKACICTSTDMYISGEISSSPETLHNSFPVNFSRCTNEIRIHVESFLSRFC